MLSMFCRLHMVFSSPKHLMVAGGCIIVMEIAYKMDFSLPGFLICCIVLGFGMCITKITSDVSMVVIETDQHHPHLYYFIMQLHFK